MTYPPQPGPPPGQQPGQYGQGGYPQQGGYQQSGQFPQDGYPQGGGGWGGPPQKGKAGLWVGLSVAAVIVVVFVITAFVAPGFLLGDNRENTTASGEDGAAGDGGDVAGAQALAERIIAALNAGDTTTLNSVTCADAEGDVAEVIGMVEQIDHATLDGAVSETGSTATAQGTVVVQGETYPSVAELAKNGDTWCWRSVAIQGPGGQSPQEPSASTAPTSSRHIDPNDPRIATGSTAEADSSITAFVDAINNGDGEAAKAMLCAPNIRTWTDRIRDAIEAGATLTAEPSEKHSETFSSRVTGTTDDREIRHGIVGVRGEKENYCVAVIGGIT